MKNKKLKNQLKLLWYYFENFYAGVILGVGAIFTIVMVILDCDERLTKHNVSEKNRKIINSVVATLVGGGTIIFQAKMRNHLDIPMPEFEKDEEL